MNRRTSSANLGTVVSVRGSVVDIRFDKYLPPIYSFLRAGTEGQIAIEVLSQLDAHRMRGIALTPTQGLARSMVVEDTGGPLQALAGKEVLSRMFDVFGNVIDRQSAPSDVQWRTVHRAPPSLARRSTKPSSSNQAFLQYVRECGQDKNLDRRVGLCPRRHRQEAPQSQHFATDFIGHPFRENALAASLSGQRINYRSGWKFQPI